MCFAVLANKRCTACLLLLTEEHISLVIITISDIAIIITIVGVATRGAANDRATAVDRFIRRFGTA
jgi:hypothetical protein